MTITSITIRVAINAIMCLLEYRVTRVETFCFV